MDTLEELFHEDLRDVYSAEKQLVKALPKVARAASSPQLKTAVENHLKETIGQVARLDEAFKLLGKPARAKTCKAMEGLVEEAKELMEEDAAPEVLDAGLIAAAQKVEHYEIASYGTLATWADKIGQSEVAALLRETLAEEKAADEKLTKLAKTEVNVKAAK